MLIEKDLLIALVEEKGRLTFLINPLYNQTRYDVQTAYNSATQRITLYHATSFIRTSPLAG
jgi:hypothetical protein